MSAEFVCDASTESQRASIITILLFVQEMKWCVEAGTISSQKGTMQYSLKSHILFPKIIVEKMIDLSAHKIT